MLGERHHWFTCILDSKYEIHKQNDEYKEHADHNIGHRDEIALFTLVLVVMVAAGSHFTPPPDALTSLQLNRRSIVQIGLRRVQELDPLSLAAHPSAWTATPDASQ